MTNLPQPRFSTALDNPFLAHVRPLPPLASDDICVFLGHDDWVPGNVSSLLPRPDDRDVPMTSEDEWGGLDHHIYDKLEVHTPANRREDMDVDLDKLDSWEGLSSGQFPNHTDTNTGGDGDHMQWDPSEGLSSDSTAISITAIPMREADRRTGDEGDRMTIDLDSWAGLTDPLPTDFSCFFREDTSRGTSHDRRPSPHAPSKRKNVTVEDASDSGGEGFGAGPSNIHQRRHDYDDSETGSAISIEDVRFRSPPPREPSNGDLVQSSPLRASTKLTSSSR